MCLLAYKRPQQLKDCIKSLTQNTDYPYQLIINLDTCDPYLLGYLTELLLWGTISNLLVNSGNNRGVGRSFQSALGVSEGDYIFKVDTDLTFKPGWLSTAVKVLENYEDVGTVSLFDYNHYDPNDNRFKPEECHLQEREGCIIVKDFVSSIYGFRKEDKHKFTGEDDGFHQTLGKMAITKQDLVSNSGFGVYKSTYVSGTEDAPIKTPTHNEPLIFQKNLAL